MLEQFHPGQQQIRRCWLKLRHDRVAVQPRAPDLAVRDEVRGATAGRELRGQPADLGLIEPCSDMVDEILSERQISGHRLSASGIKGKGATQRQWQ